VNLSRRTADSGRNFEGQNASALTSFASAFKLLDDLGAVADPKAPLPTVENNCPKGAGWWFFGGSLFRKNPLLRRAFRPLNEPVNDPPKAKIEPQTCPCPCADDVSRLELHVADLQPCRSGITDQQGADGVLFRCRCPRDLYRDFGYG